LLAEFAVALVGADQDFGRPVRVVAPRTYPEVHGLGEVLAARARAALAGEHDRMYRSHGIIGERVRVGTANDGRAADIQVNGRVPVHRDPRVASHDRDDRQGRTVLDAHAPGWPHDRAQGEGTPSPRTVEQAAERVHRS
jgi:hypothetical protein